MTLAELQALLKKQGVDFNTVVNPVGPTNEWTVAEQEEDCCQEVPGADPCVGDGKKVEPWSGWTDELKQELGFTPDGPSAQELFNRAEATHGKGNVHLVVRKVGPVPCGEKVTNFVGTLGCCTNPSELIKYQGPTTVDVDDEFTFSVLSGTGEPQITWHTIGEGITVAKKSETEADATSDSCFCNPVVVYAQDSCLSVAPWVVSRTGGSWSSIDDESLSSPFGWFQDGATGSFFVTGFNDDNTKVSTQHYFQAEYIGTKEVVCGSAMPGINDSPIVTPQDSQGFEKCESANIWVRLKEGFQDVWTVRYAIDSQSSSEFTHTCQDTELLIDTESSATEIIQFSSAQVSWDDGNAPFSVVVGGVEVYLDAAKTTNEVHNYLGRAITIYADEACGLISLTVTDSCGSSVTHKLVADHGMWVQRYYNPYGGVDGSQGYTTIEGNIYYTDADPYAGGCPTTIVKDPTWRYVTGTTYPYVFEQDGWKIQTRWHSGGVNCDNSALCCIEGSYCANEGDECYNAAVARCNGFKATSLSDTDCPWVTGTPQSGGQGACVTNGGNPADGCLGTFQGQFPIGDTSFEQWMASPRSPDSGWHSTWYKIQSQTYGHYYIYAYFGYTKPMSVILSEWICS